MRRVALAPRANAFHPARRARPRRRRRPRRLVAAPPLRRACRCLSMRRSSAAVRLALDLIFALLVEGRTAAKGTVESPSVGGKGHGGRVPRSTARVPVPECSLASTPALTLKHEALAEGNLGVWGFGVLPYSTGKPVRLPKHECLGDLKRRKGCL